MNLNPIDILVIVFYFCIIISIGLISSRKNKSNTSEDFLLAGRKLTLPLFVATLVATWYGNILGMGEFVYTKGIVAWVCFGLTYYISAGLFAVFIAGKIRFSNFQTIPEQITSKFGQKAGWISSLIVLIITIPAAYILMLGVIIQLFSGWQLWICIIIGAILSLTYIYKGGFKADVLTNTAQFVMMYVGFGALLIFTVIKFGSPSIMISKLPVSHTKLFGGFSWQIILSWFIISLQTFIDPSFHQRCSAAITPGTARKGVVVSILFWIIFDFLTLSTGLYAKAYFQIEPLMAYPILGDTVLPVFWKGIFVVALLATVMSTLDSYAFISAATIGNDIIAPILKLKKNIREISVPALTKFGLVLTGIFGVVMAVILPSAVQLIYKTASIAVPGLIIPLLLSFSTKYEIQKKKIIFLMLSSSGISLFWVLSSYVFQGNNIIINVEPMIPGLAVSLLLSGIFIKKIEIAN